MSRWMNMCVIWRLMLIAMVSAYVELPKFSQLRLLYPGYHHYGGAFRGRDLIEVIGGNHTNPVRYIHNTSPLRISITLNRYGGRHAIGVDPVSVQGEGIVSIKGRDGQQYIFQNTAFGPFIAAKYGNPQLQKPNKKDPQLTMEPFIGKQGIVRFVSYHTDHPGGHIALWDCNHFFQSPDWSNEHHMISVEFWETPDSYCAPHQEEETLNMKELLQHYRLVPKHPTSPGGQQRNHNRQSQPGGSRGNHLRHGHRSKKRHHRLKNILKKP